MTALAILQQSSFSKLFYTIWHIICDSCESQITVWMNIVTTCDNVHLYSNLFLKRISWKSWRNYFSVLHDIINIRFKYSSSLIFVVFSLFKWVLWYFNLEICHDHSMTIIERKFTKHFSYFDKHYWNSTTLRQL